ncbi:hypothetical protein M1N56_08055 [Dehalococcoidia bacterium]|nr:hypothetical protein [Dehalococcoidia bacterium]
MTAIWCEEKSHGGGRESRQVGMGASDPDGAGQLWTGCGVIWGGLYLHYCRQYYQ